MSQKPRARSGHWPLSIDETVDCKRRTKHGRAPIFYIMPSSWGSDKSNVSRLPMEGNRRESKDHMLHHAGHMLVNERDVDVVAGRRLDSAIYFTSWVMGVSANCVLKDATAIKPVGEWYWGGDVVGANDCASKCNDWAMVMDWQRSGLKLIEQVCSKLQSFKSSFNKGMESRCFQWFLPAKCWEANHLAAEPSIRPWTSAFF